ncbi:hypothetical protein ABPG75_009869 [Micractinium tetrahymenae]
MADPAISLAALGALHKQLQFLQGGAASAGNPGGAQSQSVFVPHTGLQHVSEAEPLITPVNADQPAAAFLTAAAAAPAGAAAALAPPSCCLCGGMGSEAACGALRPVTLDDQPAAVHHLCALWAPNCYMSQGSSTYVNLEMEVRRARSRTCGACGLPGASLTCSHHGCRCAYHLPCAMGAPGVVLDSESFETWCPAHSDNDGGAASDEEYHAAPTPARPRRQTGGGSTKRARPSNEAQRPRTDWQKKDENTWLKVVPPWWCEQRTVHFATKVYKELFRSSGSAVLIDHTGGEWLCMVQTEARNDNRPQYTLRGQFAELWQAQGICSGDTLIFKRDPLSGHIELSRISAGSGAAAGARMEEAAGSELSDSMLPETSGGTGLAFGGSGRRGTRHEATSEHGRGHSMQGSHPNRWMELPDGWAVKTVYKSTLAHQQCPIAGWLFKKLYGRLPGDTDRAPMYDPDLDAEYRFDVSFVSAANVHYVTGRTFSTWVRESGLQAGEQIRIRKETGTGRVRVDFTSKAASRSASLAHMEMAAVAGAPAEHGLELASPPPADALEALDALVAAAGYAGTHGTPAIQAALAGLGGPGAAAAAAAAAAPLPQPKRQRVGDATDGGTAAELLLAQQEQAVLTARAAAGGGLLLPGLVAAAAPSGSLADWKPSSLHALMFSSISDILAAHEWSPQEQSELLRFRAKYAWLDACGREVAYLTISQLRADKPALLEFVRAAGQGILTQLAGSTAAAAGRPGSAVAAAVAAAARMSPFVAAAAATTPVAAGAAAQQQGLQQERQQEQKPEAGALLGGGRGGPLAAASLELPGAAEDGGLGMSGLGLGGPGLEGASSFNMDLSGHYFGTGHGAVKREPQEQCRVGETPDPVAALGPAAAH